MSAIETLISVLCGPDGKCCISGSDDDRRLIDSALAELAQAAQPAPAPATQPAPVPWVSPEQFANFMDADEAPFGKYVPARKTSAGNFTMPLFAASAQGFRDGVAKGQQARWQPIETAPKEGQAILVTDGSDCYCVEWSEEFDWWTVDDNKLGPFRLRGSAPTHWMPLPPAPGPADGESK